LLGGKYELARFNVVVALDEYALAFLNNPPSKDAEQLCPLSKVSAMDFLLERREDYKFVFREQPAFSSLQTNQRTEINTQRTELWDFSTIS